jgi:hypothetical protein
MVSAAAFSKSSSFDLAKGLGPGALSVISQILPNPCGSFSCLKKTSARIMNSYLLDNFCS